MAITWTPALAVGVSHIDEEHKELFDRVNKLLDAMQQSRAKEQIAPLVGFLKDYVNVHFGGEAALMQRHRYPEAQYHLAQHAFFVAEFRALAEELEKAGPTALITIKLNKLLCDWLRQHIASTDKKLGAFLAGVSATAQA
jgi:hemerythrin